jgi:hypothetical protein
LIVGVLVGGTVAERSASSVPLWFAGTQGAIAILGALSPMVIHLAARAMGSSSALLTVFMVAGLQLPPAFLIGASLPMLAANQIRGRRNVGDATGRMHFSLMLGAGVGSALAAIALLGPLGQAATVQVAAVLNLGAGLFSYTHSRTPKIIR